MQLGYTQQRIVAECTVVYKVETQDLQTYGMYGLSKENKVQSKAIKTVYIKSNNARIDLVSPSFSQSTIYNKTTATATVLRTFGGDKYSTTLTAQQWKKLNAPLDSTRVEASPDSVSILDYNCKKVVLHLKDNTSVIVYYTPSIIASVKDYEYLFKDIPGFVLGYEMLDAAGIKTVFRAIQINLYNPVAASTFDIPSEGYRIISEK